MFELSKIIEKSTAWMTLFIGSVFVLSSLSGCSAQEKDKTQITDKKISEAVERNLVSTRGVDSETITVSTYNGIVSLDGKATNILSKERAARVASNIKGVKSVVNNVAVASSMDDESVQKQVKTALLADPATESWEIQTTVENGLVSLEGEVDSWQERELAATIVKGVRGVLAVANDLDVVDHEDRSDIAIKNEVLSTLRWNSRVDDGLIVVDVTSGVVNLSGSVGSLYEKNLTTALSYVSGVNEVNAQKLEVKSWLEGDMDRTMTTEAWTEEDAEEAIRRAFNIHPRIEKDAITVDVQRGSATITGTVSNLKTARAAAEIVKNTKGVTTINNQVDVFNEIIVKPEINLTDMELKSSIEEAYQRDPYVTPATIDVAVNDGVVSLSGTASTYFEKYQADEVASRINGVVRINNDLEVGYAELDVEPEFYDWDVVDYDYDYDREDRVLTDAELKKAVERELTWSPYVAHPNVTIEVQNGIVTLTGSVSTLRSATEATEEAYEAGAVQVYNRLELI